MKFQENLPEVLERCVLFPAKRGRIVGIRYNKGNEQRSERHVKRAYCKKINCEAVQS